MSIQTTIAAAVWAYPTRTLATGVPDSPTLPTDWIAKAIWEYVTRTLGGYDTEGAADGLGRIFSATTGKFSVFSSSRSTMKVRA